MFIRLINEAKSDATKLGTTIDESAASESVNQSILAAAEVNKAEAFESEVWKSPLNDNYSSKPYTAPNANYEPVFVHSHDGRSSDDDIAATGDRPFTSQITDVGVFRGGITTSAGSVSLIANPVDFLESAPFQKIDMFAPLHIFSAERKEAQAFPPELQHSPRPSKILRQNLCSLRLAVDLLQFELKFLQHVNRKKSP